jgi:BolA family transcriptional regulator, general stress-responsive regulator
MNVNRVDLIRSRLEQAFTPDFLEVIDESDKHIGHAGHQGGNRHFAIKIQAAAFYNISRVEAHRKIYALFTDLMPEQIHALRIEIKK